MVRPQDLAETLVRRQRAMREQQRRRAADVRRALEAEMGAAHRERLFARAWLIGSLASGTFGPHSDVDVVVEGLARADERELWSRLEAALVAEIDLLRLEDLPASVRESVLAQGEPLRVA